MTKKLLSIFSKLTALAFTAGALLLCCAFCLSSGAHTPRRAEGKITELYSYTTYFDAKNADRSHNIRLAAERINGSVIGAGHTFSFNAAVGARTEDRGFKRAKIIEEGRFVLGVGGGVCQASTTLYNAALLSGLEITEYHPHRLQVGYVPPSRDAMVSGSYYDLKFKNTQKTPVYIRAKCGEGWINCTIFGAPSDIKYSFVSRTVGVNSRPEPIILEGDSDKIITYGRDGLESEGYLVKECGGVRGEELIRRDKYLAVADVVQIKRTLTAG